jgi:hypothetical protein
VRLSAAVAALWFVGFIAPVHAGSLLGGITAQALVETPKVWRHSILITEEKPGRCFPLFFAGPVNKTRIENKGFLPPKGGVDITLGAGVTHVWNFRSSDLRIVGTCGVMEQCRPDTNALSWREQMNVITGTVSSGAQFRDGIALAFWNVADRINLETPVSPKRRLSPCVDDSQLDVNWFAIDKNSVIRAVDSYPGSIGLNGRIIGVLNTKIDDANARQRNNRAQDGDCVKPYGYPDLPTPETPLVGAVLVLGGEWMNARGIVRGPLVAMLIGWVLMVCGGLALLLWALPKAACWASIS